MDIYQNPERIGELKEWKIQKAKLKTGKELMALSKKYFSRSLFGVGKNKKMKVPSEYLQLYADWQSRKEGNEEDEGDEEYDEGDEFYNDIMKNPNSYYNDLDALYVAMGRNLFIKVSNVMTELTEKATVREAYYGGAFKDYAFAIEKTERYREYGNEATEIVARIWNDELKKKIRKKQAKRDLSPPSRALKAQELLRQKQEQEQADREGEKLIDEEIKAREQADREAKITEAEESAEVIQLKNEIDELDGVIKDTMFVDQWSETMESSIPFPETEEGINVITRYLKLHDANFKPLNATELDEAKEHLIVLRSIYTGLTGISGSGIDVEDYARWSKKLIAWKKKYNQPITRETMARAFENKMVGDKREAFYSPLEIFYIDLSNTLKQLVFEQAREFARIMNME